MLCTHAATPAVEAAILESCQELLSFVQELLQLSEAGPIFTKNVRGETLHTIRVLPCGSERFQLSGFGS